MDHANVQVSCLLANLGHHDNTLSKCRCPALAQVSGREEKPADYALALLIRQQTPEDKVLVAQSAGHLLGCMAVTSMVDVSPLQQNFDLQVYDQLVQPEVYEAALAAYEHRRSSGAAGESSHRGCQQQLTLASSTCQQICSMCKASYNTMTDACCLNF